MSCVHRAASPALAARYSFKRHKAKQACGRVRQGHLQRARHRRQPGRAGELRHTDVTFVADYPKISILRGVWSCRRPAATRLSARPIGGLFQPLLRMVAGLDGHERGDAQSQLFRVEQSHPLLDYASGFQTPYPLPAGRERQPDPLCHLSDRQARIALKRIKNIDVDIIHRRSRTPATDLKITPGISFFVQKQFHYVVYQE